MDFNNSTIGKGAHDVFGALGDVAIGMLGDAYNENRAKGYTQWQNQQNIEVWKMMQEYNSPAEQINRLQKAGLNPNLINSNVSNTASSLPAAATAPELPTTGFYQAQQNAYDRGFRSADLDIRQKELELNRYRTDIEMKKVAADTKVAQEDAIVKASTNQQIQKSIEEADVRIRQMIWELAGNRMFGTRRIIADIRNVEEQVRNNSISNNLREMFGFDEYASNIRKVCADAGYVIRNTAAINDLVKQGYLNAATNWQNMLNGRNTLSFQKDCEKFLRGSGYYKWNIQGMKWNALDVKTSLPLKLEGLQNVNSAFWLEEFYRGLDSAANAGNTVINAKTKRPVTGSASQSMRGNIPSPMRPQSNGHYYAPSNTWSQPRYSF